MCIALATEEKGEGEEGEEEGEHEQEQKQVEGEEEQDNIEEAEEKEEAATYRLRNVCRTGSNTARCRLLSQAERLGQTRYVTTFVSVFAQAAKHPRLRSHLPKKSYDFERKYKDRLVSILMSKPLLYSGPDWCMYKLIIYQYTTLQQ